MGVRIIEKHIANENQKEGVDIAFSLKGSEIRKFVNDIREVNKILGKKKFIRSKKELHNTKLRRSIYVTKEIKKDNKISKENIKVIRPNNGLDPSYYYKVINKKVKNCRVALHPINISCPDCKRVLPSI